MPMEHSPKIEYYQKRPFGDKLNATFAFLRENAWPYLKVQLLIAGPILLLVNIIVGQFQLSVLSFDVTQDPDSFFGDFFRVYGFLLMAAMIAGSIVPTLAYNYMERYQSLAPVDITIAQVTRKFGKRFLYVLAYNIITAIVSVIGAIFFFIPGIYLWVVLSLGSCVIVFEGTDPLTAFGRCFTLIKEKWFSTFGLLIVTFIVGYIVSMLFSLPQSIIYGLWAFSSLESGTLNEAEMPLYMEVLSIVFATLQSFGNILMYSLIYIGLAFQYFNLVEMRESRGLMSRIESMDQEQNDEEGETY